MKTLIRKVKLWIRPWLGPKIIYYFFRSYQSIRSSNEKFSLISSKVDLSRINNILDVGCNEGRITRQFMKVGKFSVGIDALPCFSEYMNDDEGLAFGIFPLNLKNVELIPSFDLILLLSVHHQWVRQYGDGYAKKLVKKIISKTRRYFIIEFAALSEKYGYKKPLFLDNNEQSVRKYAEEWLNSIEFSGEIQYVGKNKEESGKEPFRYIYMIEKK